MKKNVVRLLFALVALLTSANMLAENKLWIQQYSANEDGTYEFAVMMENDANVAALQFNLLLPPEVTIVQDASLNQEFRYVRPNPERLNVSQKFMCTPLGKNDDKYSVFQCAVFAMRNDTFIGTSGPVAFFTIRATDPSALIFSKPLDIRLEKIGMSNFAGDPQDCNNEWADDVTVLPETKLSTSLSSVTVNPGASFILPIELDNSYMIQGLQFNLTLPKGFAIIGQPTLNPDRISAGSEVMMPETPNPQVNCLMLVNMSTGAYVLRNTGTGQIMEVEIKAPDKLEGDLTITVDAVIASCDDVAYPGTGFTLSVVDGSVALTNANAKVDALQAAYDAAIQTIATECPDVKDNFKGEDIQTAINDLKAAVNSAYENGTLTADYDNVMAPAATIEANIAQLVDDAKAAQATEAGRQAANLAAYNDALAQVAELQTNLDNTVKVIDADYADYKDADAIAAVQAKIDAAKAAVEAAYAAVAVAGEFQNPVDVAAINTEIDGLLLAAQAAKVAAENEAARQEANQKAYDASLAEIAALQKHYDETVAAIQKDYADFEDKNAEATVQGMIDAAGEAAAAALAAVEKEGEYKYSVDKAGITDAIDALLQAAKDAKKKAEDDAEAARQQLNKESYEADLAALEDLYASYRATVAKIQAEYAAFENVSAELTVRNSLDDAKAEVEKAYKAVAKEGTYSYVLDVEGLQASIDKLLEDAIAAKQAANAEELRQNENLNAYNAVIATIDALQKDLDDTIAVIKADYADFEDKDAEAAVQASINDLRAKADAAYKAVEKEGKFEYTVDPAPVSAAIDKLLSDAKAAADAAAKEAERVAANKKAYDAVIATIDALQKELDDAIATIKANYADFEDKDAEAAVQANIDALRATADEAYKAVEKEGKFEYTVDPAPVSAEIAKLISDAKALADAATAEAERVARNQAAYDEVMDLINAVKAERNEAATKIADEYDLYDPAEELAAIDAALAAAEKAANDALEAVKDAGEYGYTFDAEAVRALIAEMLANAEKVGAVDSIEAEVQSGNLIIFTLDGKRHANPVHGEVNIFVRKNGKTSKVMVD